MESYIIYIYILYIYIYNMYILPGPSCRGVMSGDPYVVFPASSQVTPRSEGAGTYLESQFAPGKLGTSIPGPSKGCPMEAYR